MPTLPKRFKPGGAGVGRVLEARTPAKVDAERRGTAASRGYDNKWRQASKGYLRKHPLCVCCEANGLVAAATLLDHIEPHRCDMVKFWERSNWQGLCDTCHNSIKATLERRWFAGKIDLADLRLDRRLTEFFPPA